MSASKRFRLRPGAAVPRPGVRHPRRHRRAGVPPSLRPNNPGKRPMRAALARGFPPFTLVSALLAVLLQKMCRENARMVHLA